MKMFHINSPNNNRNYRYKYLFQNFMTHTQTYFERDVQVYVSLCIYNREKNKIFSSNYNFCPIIFLQNLIRKTLSGDVKSN